MEENRYIFDMDGTLYDFDADISKGFAESTFCSELRERIAMFVMDRYELDLAEAEALVSHIKNKYDGELSLGFEKEKGLCRYEYFENTWNIDPEKYISVDPGLRKLLLPLAGRALLLTAAPGVWAKKVLEYLDVEQAFGDKIITGESDLRKPDPAVFVMAANMLEAPASQIVSIGDQVYSDIIPARSIGMQTVLIGSQSSEADMSFDTVCDAIRYIEGLS